MYRRWCRDWYRWAPEPRCPDRRHAPEVLWSPADCGRSGYRRAPAILDLCRWVLACRLPVPGCGPGPGCRYPDRNGRRGYRCRWCSPFCTAWGRHVSFVIMGVRGWGPLGVEGMVPADCHLGILRHPELRPALVQVPACKGVVQANRIRQGTIGCAIRDGHHGRADCAAVWVQSYGNGPVQALQSTGFGVQPVKTPARFWRCSTTRQSPPILPADNRTICRCHGRYSPPVFRNHPGSRTAAPPGPPRAEAAGPPQFDQIGIGGACGLAVFKGRYPTESCGGLGEILRRGAGDKDVPDAIEGAFLVLRHGQPATR